MTRLSAALALACAVAAVGGCFTGPSVGNFRPAVSGHGVETDIRLRTARVQGELLEVRDTAYVVIGDDGVLLVPFSAVRATHFSGVDDTGAGAPDPALAETLKLMSRFPRGIPRQALEQILADARQTSLKVVR